MYDGAPRLQVPTGVTIIGFVDDIGMTIVTQHIKEIDILTWLKGAGLALVWRLQSVKRR